MVVIYYLFDEYALKKFVSYLSSDFVLKAICIMDDILPSACDTVPCDLADSSEGVAHVHRPLTAEEQELLKCQATRSVSERRQNQLESEARKHWDLFYKRNSTKFFKDRHWTLREFQELSGVGLVRCEIISKYCTFS